MIPELFLIFENSQPLMIDSCVFCTLSKSRDDILYEDSLLFVIVDVSPLAKGHILFIPKEHSEFLHGLSEEALSHILPTVKKVVKLLNYQKYNLLQNNVHLQSVPHVHFHIVPATEENALIVKWETMKVDHKFLETLRKNIKEALA